MMGALWPARADDEVSLSRKGQEEPGDRAAMLLAASVAPPPLQNTGGIGIDEHRESITKAIRFSIDQDSAFASDATAQHTSQTQQGAAAANFTGFAPAVADDFAVGTEDSFQERNGAQNRLPSVTVGHKTLSLKLAALGRLGKCLIVQDAGE